MCLGTLLTELLIRVDEERERIRIVLEDVVGTASEEDSALHLCNLEDGLCLLDIHAVVLRHAVVGIVPQIAVSRARRIVGTLDECVEIICGPKFLRCHSDDLAVITTHTQLLGNHLRNLTTATAILARDRDKCFLIHRVSPFRSANDCADDYISPRASRATSSRMISGYFLSSW